MGASHEPNGDRWDPVLYDEKHSFVWKYGAGVLELLDPKPGERILDLGCGTGHLTAKIAETGATVVGIDPSPAMLEQARVNYPTLAFELASVQDYSPSEPFDAVFANAVVHWVKEPEQLIAGVRRVLKPGGRFVAEFGGSRNLATVLHAFEEAHQEVAGRPFESPWYFPGIGEYAGLLDSGGFETELAQLIDRPTPLEGESRLKSWIQMYLPDTLTQLSTNERSLFVSGVEDRLRRVAYRDGVWLLDHRRLRVKAVNLS